MNNYVLTATGTAGTIQGEANLQFDGNTLSVTGDTNISGALTAASKSFDIVHPTKNGFRLRYGVLEGPEHGVYLRGNTNSNVIELPDYWTGLVHEESITVQLTPIGSASVYYLEKIEDNKIYLKCDDENINVSYFIQAERKDVDRPNLEYKS